MGRVKRTSTLHVHVHVHVRFRLIRAIPCNFGRQETQNVAHKRGRGWGRVSLPIVARHLVADARLSVPGLSLVGHTEPKVQTQTHDLLRLPNDTDIDLCACPDRHF